MLALTLKNRGLDVKILFEDHFFMLTGEAPSFLLHDFEGRFKDNSFYLEHFTVENKENNLSLLKAGDVLHMRIDPPFDARYLRYLWMLQHLSSYGVKVVNSPDGILLHNEKLYAYQDKSATLSYIGANFEGFWTFVGSLKKAGHESLIIKPVDLFQGVGVERFDIDQLGREKNAKEMFERLVAARQGPLIAQPFNEEVLEGETRSLYYKGTELGSILKIPPSGGFLANIASGATYRECSLTEKQREICDRVSSRLIKFGIDFIAFDILGDSLSEVNVTCPGLLVEVSQALNKNLAEKIIDINGP